MVANSQRSHLKILPTSQYQVQDRYFSFLFSECSYMMDIALFSPVFIWEVSSHILLLLGGPRFLLSSVPCIVIRWKVKICNRIQLLLLPYFPCSWFTLCVLGFTHIHSRFVIHLKRHVSQYFQYFNYRHLQYPVCHTTRTGALFCFLVVYLMSFIQFKTI